MIPNLFTRFRRTYSHRGGNPRLAILRFATELESMELRQMLSAISWVGGTNGNWNVPGNWNLNRVPNQTDQVTIDPAGASTVRIVGGDGIQVSSLTTGADDTLSFTDGQLGISATSTLNGPLTMIGGTLVAQTGAVVTVNGATTVSGGSLFASGGAAINLPMLTTDSAPAGKSSIFQADGMGSFIDLSALTTITNRSNGNLAVTAVNGGEIDLSALASVSNISGTFTLNSRDKDINGTFSNIDVSSLTTVGGSGNGYNVQNGGTIDSPILSSWINGTIAVNGGTYNFSNFTSINTSSVFVTSTTVAGIPNPAIFTLPNITTYTSTVASGNGRQFQANEDDAELRFPALTTITNTGGGSVEPRALNGGLVDLPVLTSVVNTNGHFHPLASGTADDASPSVLNIANLGNIAGSGNVLTVQNGAVIQFGTITNWINNTINVTGTDYIFANLTNINTSSIFVNGGGSLTLPNITTYTSTIPSGNGRQFQAEGAISRLLFPALATITNTGGGSIEPRAFNGGLVDLPALTTVTNTNGTFNPDSESTDGQGNPSVVNLSNLLNFSGAGNVLTLKTNGVVLFDKITNWINNVINVTGGVYSLANLTNVNTSSIAVNGGGSLTLPNITTYTSTVTAGNGRNLQADGAASSLNFPALTTITNTGGGAINPRAFNGGLVDIPALATVVNTSGNFNPDSEGTDGQGNPSIVNISNLANLSGAGNDLTVKNQGVVQFDTITSWNGNTINVAGSQYTFANLTSVNNTSISVTSNGSLTLPNVVTITNNISPGNGRQIQANGSQTRLSLPGLTTINILGGGSFEPRVFSGGDVELTALTSVVITNGLFNPSADGKDNVGTASVINMPVLVDVSGSGSSNLKSVTGAQIRVPDLSNLHGSVMNIDIGAGSEVDGPSGIMAWPLANTDGAIVAIPQFPQGVKLLLNASTYSNMTIYDSVSTPVVLKGGTFTETTALNLTAGATVDLTGGVTTTFSGNLNGTGEGTATVTNGNLQAGSGGLTLNFLDEMFQWTGGNINSAQGNLTNAGRITVAGGNTRQITGGDPLTNTGSISLTAGTSLTVGDNVDSSGGDISVSPGSTLTVQGTLTFSSLSSLKVQVAGNSGNPVFGKLTATGAATLAGPLDVELIGGFVPAGGTTMNFLTAASLAGSFAPVSNVTPGSAVGFTSSSTTPGVQKLTVVGANAPVISVLSNGQSISDGATTTSAANNTAFGNALVGTPISKTFTISNSAGATGALSIGQVTISGANPGDFTVTAQPASSVAAGASTTFTIQFNPSAVGNRTATVSFTEDDPTQTSPFTFAIGGEGTQSSTSPVITVTGNNQAIVDGTTTTSLGNNTNFGATVVKRGTSTPITQTYTITNSPSATGTLHLGTISIEGANASAFTVVAQPANSLAPGASTTFAIRFQPTATGTSRAVVSFSEDDPNQSSPFTFAISGEGVNKIVQAKTITTLTSNIPNPSAGQSVILTARVTVETSGAPIPTGTITIKKGRTVLGTGALTVVNGQAQVSITTTQLVAGNNALTAAFDGTSALTKSTGKLKIKIAKPPRN